MTKKMCASDEISLGKRIYKAIKSFQRKTGIELFTHHIVFLGCSNVENSKFRILRVVSKSFFDNLTFNIQYYFKDILQRITGTRIYVGDYVECIVPHNNQIKGHIYKVAETSKTCGTHFIGIESPELFHGIDSGWLASDFKKVNKNE